MIEAGSLTHLGPILEKEARQGNETVELRNLLKFSVTKVIKNKLTSSFSMGVVVVSTTRGPPLQALKVVPYIVGT
jgi:hypothetical protein